MDYVRYIDEPEDEPIMIDEQYYNQPFIIPRNTVYYYYYTTKKYPMNQHDLKTFL